MIKMETPLDKALGINSCLPNTKKPSLVGSETI